ncbi:helix-turn-helix domain-containing protein [Cerasicoccus arenae]|uniref:AraC family transcriptional regulator n=1 Tax=Cerasicoccus arenae TaxID=424488 RepID=A0A8J3DF99_9BACT|nr:AraC family transcriptional regulator [Cerasicoccus arenae]MBK1859998.1 helix-turn-helix domain-containing protein [Cerasicoccus arenae]GHC13208.1 AraC family transcriptional regulator [Cerasicoccus arenae]
METRAKFEYIVTQENESFRCFYIEGQRFDHAYHYHPEIELTLILESSGMRLVGDTLKPFMQGDLCLLSENLPHLYHNGELTEAKPDQKARAIVLQFRRDCLGGVFDSAVELQAISKMLDRANRGLRFPSEAARAIQGQMTTLLRARESERLCLMLEVLDYLAKYNSEPIASAGYRPNLNDYRSERISKASHYILNHFHEELTQADVARHIGMTTSAFSRFFQRTTNQSYAKFLGDIRMGHACHLLLESDMPITDVCYAAGFSNLSNFNRRFKARLGRSPRSYRDLTAF